VLALKDYLQLYKDPFALLDDEKQKCSQTLPPSLPPSSPLQARIDEGAAHVLALKDYLQLYEDPFVLLHDEKQKDLIASVGSEKDKALALGREGGMEGS